jgi:cbb3-type cytochrome oxidase subunit 3
MSPFLDLLSTYGLFLGIPILFLLIVFWIYRPGAARRYREDARLPFAEGEESARPPPPRGSRLAGDDND